MKYIMGIFITAFLSGFTAKDKSAKNDWVGNYQNADGIILTVKDQSLVDFTFEIVNKSSACQESFHGKAVLNSPTNANYTDKDNILMISLLRAKDGKIEVTERGFQHAPTCLEFSGIFKPAN